MQTRYVNTASTAGGTGTTNGTAGATRAYASLQEALDALTATGTLSDAWTFYCEGTAADTLPLTQTHMNWINSPDNYVLITTTQANRHDGKYNTGKYRIELTDFSAFYNNQPCAVRIDGIQVQITISTSSGSDYSAFRLSTANNTARCDHRFSNCLAKFVISGGATDNGYGFQNSDTTVGGTVSIRNCITLGGYCGFASDGTNFGRDYLTNYNCTAYGNEFPFLDVQGCINCIAAGATGGGGAFVSTGSFRSSNNAADDATAPGPNSRQTQTFTFVNAAGGDVHLQTSDVGAKFGGKIAPAGLLYDDIDGVERVGIWDIGADQQSTQLGYPAINARRASVVLPPSRP